MDGQNSERRRPMFQVRNFLSVTGSFLKRIIAASTIAAVVSISTMVIGISLMAMARVGESLIIDGSQTFQSIDGFGVNANSASWKNRELRPAIDMLVDQLGATIFRGKRSPGVPSYAAGRLPCSMSAGVGSKDGAGCPQSAASQAAVT
jgi:hypothetical protein